MTNTVVGTVPLIDQYMLCPPLQEYFVDKITGLPLAGGVVTFYRDQDRITLKPIYVISGTPTDPVFVELPNPLTLSPVGTFMDPNNNNDIVPYLKPFDDAGNVDLYYITVTGPSPGFVPQFTREFWPGPIAVSGGDLAVTTDNIIPNGQFDAHLNPAGGNITIANTLLAYGGWSFNLDSGFTSTNTISFSRFAAAIATPPPAAEPRYAVNVTCSVPNAAENVKDLRVSMADLNLLQNQPVTFQFDAISNDSSSHDVEFVIIYHPGAGGDPVSTQIIQTITIAPAAYNSYPVAFTMPDTTSIDIGTGDDDYIQLAIRFPRDTTFNISLTNFIFVNGTFDSLAYQPQSVAQSTGVSLPASWAVPAVDGSDNGKFLLANNAAVEHGITQLGFTWAFPTLINIQVFTTSGTYTPTPTTRAILVFATGGGGAGGSSGSGSSPGTNGANTTFGALCAGLGGSRGSSGLASNGAPGGAGGNATGATFIIDGNDGSAGGPNVSGFSVSGGSGGGSYFGGGSGSGGAPTANTGAGGSGAASGTSATGAGGGGGSGGTAALFTTTVSSQTITIGGGGSSGSPGTGGFVGNVGAAGILVVYEYGTLS